MEHRQWKEWLERSLHGDIAPRERKALEDHLVSCAECRADLEDLKLLQAKIGEAKRLEVTDAMLLEARQELRAALRVAQSRVSFWDSAMEWIDELLAPWAKASLAAAALLAVGFVGGYLVFQTPVTADGLMIQQISDNTEILRGQPQIANVKFEDADPSDDEISFAFDAVSPMKVKGSPNDPGIQSVLTKAIMSEENPGVRLRAVSAITSQIQIQTSAPPPESDNEVKHALVEAMKYDPNPGVRREALLALRKFWTDDEIRKGLLYVLNKDQNDGMRVEAINSLANAKDGTYASDQYLQEILRKRVESDNNRYVRQKARAVLQEVQ